jgi:hypothetical protein
MGAVAKSYMRKSFLIYLVINEEAFWISFYIRKI